MEAFLVIYVWLHVANFSLASGQLSYKQNEKTLKGHGSVGTRTTWLWRQRHRTALCPALHLCVGSQEQCKK